MWKGIGIGLLAIVLVMVVASLFGAFGLGFDRAAKPFAEETRRLEYDQSRSYQQGTQLRLANLCRERQSEQDEIAKKGIEDLIRTTADTYTGPLPAHVEACLMEVN